MMDHPHSQIIDDLGGNKVLYERLNLSQPAVSLWRRRGISWRYRYAVAQIAQEKGVDLPDDFLTPV